MYVMDNGSKRPLNTTIQDWIDRGVVHYEYWNLQRGDLLPGEQRIMHDENRRADSRSLFWVDTPPHRV